MTVSIIDPIGGHGAMDYYDYGLAYGLGENDVCVFFYTSEETNTRVYRNVQTKLIFKGVWGSSILKKTWRYMKGHREAYIDSKKNKAKIVHLHFFSFRSIDLLMLLIARVYGFKVMVTVHDVNSFHGNSKKFVERSCYRLIDGVIVHNQASADAISEKSFKTNQIAIIPHGNYLPFISTDGSKKCLSTRFNILFFGQIKKVKGLDVLLKAIQRVVAINDNIAVLVAGRPWKDDQSTYQSMISELGLSLFVKTDFRYIPDEEVADFFQEADIVALPYKEIYQSGVLLLTMSYGKPVLCSDLKPFKEIIKDKETGFLFKSEDDKDLADKLLELMANPELLLKVSKKASVLIQNDFDWITIGHKTLDFYRQILKSDY